MDTRYFVAFDVPPPFDKKICRLMDWVATATSLEPSYLNLPPHVTFHPPVTGIRESVLHALITSVAFRMRPTHMRVNALDHFGKHYIVLPVQSTQSVARLWVGINQLLRCLPEYEHGAYDDENTLHISVATKTSEVFDRAWPKIQQMRFEPMTIPVSELALYRKPLGGVWQKIATFSFPVRV